MGRIGFWQLLLDDKLSYWEAQRINEAQDAADYAQVQASDAARTTYSLAARVDTMSREIIMLRTALTVLTQHLKETRVVDEQALDQRLEAAMEAVFPKPPPPMPAIAPAKILITCLKCRQQVEAGTTFMTADGPVCERPCTK